MWTLMAALLYIAGMAPVGMYTTQSGVPVSYGDPGVDLSGGQPCECDTDTDCMEKCGGEY